MQKNTLKLKKGLAQMLKGGVIMDVVNAEQARVAQEAGAVAVMAKIRIGHFVEAQILGALGKYKLEDLKIKDADGYF